MLVRRVVVLGLGLILGLSACVKKKVVKPEEVVNSSYTDQISEEIVEGFEVPTVYFDFDKSDVKDSYKAELLVKATALLATSKKSTIFIAGYCDERGTEEYNLGLGHRRIESVAEYLISLGVNSSTIVGYNFGESYPADPRHNEEAWAKNRRVEIKVVWH